MRKKHLPSTSDRRSCGLRKNELYTSERKHTALSMSRKGGTHARVLSPTLAHENNNNKKTTQ